MKSTILRLWVYSYIIVLTGARKFKGCRRICEQLEMEGCAELTTFGETTLQLSAWI